MWNMINALANKEYGNIHTIGNKFYVIFFFWATNSMLLEIQNYQILVPTIDSPLSGELLIPYSVFKTVEGFEQLQLSSSLITKCPL